MSLSDASFVYVQGVLRARSAHHLENDKAYLVESRLLPVARRHGFKSVEAFVLRLRGQANERLLAEVVEAMTINETFFFHDGHPFEALRCQVLPELIRLRSATRCLNVWCAACSSGQEPYSIAMLLQHLAPLLVGWNVQLFASDLSGAMLERARQGTYRKVEVARGLPPEFLHAYFRQEKGGWRISEEIRRRVTFLTINLSGAWPELPPMDLVLLRNVLIYFDVPTKQRILRRVRDLLQPDGYLLLGGAETTHNLVDDFVSISIGESSFYRPRPGQPG